MWSLNRLACGPRAGFQIGYFGIFFASLILLEPPIFIVFLYKFSFKILKFGHNFGQNLRPSKTNLNLVRAVLWSLNCPSKWDPEFKPKNKDTKKTITTRNPTLLSAERSVFGETNCYFLGLGLLTFLWPKTCKDHSAKKNKKQGALLFLFVVLSFVGVSQTRRNNKTTNNNNNQNKNTNQAEQKNQKHQKERQHQTNRPIKLSKQDILLFLGVVLSLVVVVAQTTKTKQQNHNTTKQPTNNQK